MLKQMLRGIDHAHRAGILHRDLKPSNVMVTPQGNVKVMDFGLAKNQHGPKRTSAFGAGGTLLYMSPEQVQGLGNVDERSDLYSLGMTFYEMLAGRLPFGENDSDYAIRKAIVEKEFPPPHQYNPAVPPALSEIVRKAIQKQSHQRFQSANEMLEAVAPPPPPKPKPRERDSKRSAWRIALPAILAVFVVLILLDPEFFRKPNPPAKTVPSTLSIDSRPNGAAVFLNGDSIGLTPIKNFALEAGKVMRLRLRKTNHAGIDTSIIPKAGQPLPLAFSLRPIILSLLPMPKKIPPPLEGSLKITSVPSGATVFLNGKLAGETPYSDQQVRAAEYRLVVQQNGYVKEERMIAVRSGQPTAINVILQVEMGSIDVASQPSGAAVLIDGKRAGVTPLNLQKNAGRYAIVLRKAGYKDYSTDATVQVGKVTYVKGTLTIIESTGKLSILVNPSGSIYIDGKIQKVDANLRLDFDLAAGAHRLRVEHPGYGVWEKTIIIKSNEELDVFIDFNKTVKATVTSTPSRGRIWIDNQETDYETPRQIELRVGLHTIEVRRDGYLADKKPLNIENDLQEPLKFVLKQIQ